MTKPDICPCCGLIVPPKIALTGAVRPRLYEYIAAHREGVTNRQVMDHLYADDPNGGPVSSNIVCVMVHHINRELASHGVAIRSRGGPGAKYRLVALSE